jgi:hypothetical protein
MERRGFKSVCGGDADRRDNEAMSEPLLSGRGTNRVEISASFH